MKAMLEIDYFWSNSDRKVFEYQKLQSQDSIIIRDFEQNGVEIYGDNTPVFKKKYIYTATFEKKYLVYLYYNKRTQEPIRLQIFDYDKNMVGVIERNPNNPGPSSFIVASEFCLLR